MSQTNVNKRVYSMVFIALMVALTAICAWISIPTTIPFTLQTFAVFVAAGLLGGKRGTLAIFIYVLLGAIGIPVFAGFASGFGIIMGPTGGYILGFIVNAAVTGFMIDKLGKSIPVLVISMLVGLLVCYAFGTAWFVLVYTKTTEAIGVISALSMCVLPYLIPDFIKIALATVLVRRLDKHVNL